MICKIITEVKFHLVNDLTPMIYRTDFSPRGYLTMDEVCKEAYPGMMGVEYERIHPVQYIDPITNEKVHIGMTKEVYEHLNLPYAAIENATKTLERTKAQIDKKRETLNLKNKQIDKAKKNLLYHQGRSGTWWELHDKVYKFENMSIWEFIKLRFKKNV